MVRPQSPQPGTRFARACFVLLAALPSASCQHASSKAKSAASNAGGDSLTAFLRDAPAMTRTLIITQGASTEFKTLEIGSYARIISAVNELKKLETVADDALKSNPSAYFSQYLAAEKIDLIYTTLMPVIDSTRDTSKRFRTEAYTNLNQKILEQADQLAAATDPGLDSHLDVAALKKNLAAYAAMCCVDTRYAGQALDLVNTVFAAAVDDPLEHYELTADDAALITDAVSLLDAYRVVALESYLADRDQRVRTIAPLINLRQTVFKASHAASPEVAAAWAAKVKGALGVFLARFDYYNKPTRSTISYRITTYPNRTATKGTLDELIILPKPVEPALAVGYAAATLPLADTGLPSYQFTYIEAPNGPALLAQHEVSPPSHGQATLDFAWRAFDRDVLAADTEFSLDNHRLSALARAARSTGKGKPVSIQVAAPGGDDSSTSH